MIRLKNIYKAYDDLVVLKDFNIDFEDEKITALLDRPAAERPPC